MESCIRMRFVRIKGTGLMVGIWMTRRRMNMNKIVHKIKIGYIPYPKNPNFKTTNPTPESTGSRPSTPIKKTKGDPHWQYPAPQSISLSKPMKITAYKSPTISDLVDVQGSTDL